ncbi:disulfide bond formation protein B [Pseudomonas sp. FW215-R2]|uniref:disulfide bond formation protein B n=1 Tax=unclassified Pseudomonas TaxID=196821 RepID=UPI000BC4E16A|nr:MULTISPECIES: disulfide bond formation protein B [unclassified Pseudomonas]PCR98263.1 disulfide bond formation protein B [Pseudomonas fluorescens]PMX04180.1 disulfide bond formation protein B [Pseudomonas sp. FW215-R2]PMX10148.1 disulfide bond formation protein B [Pseudomonas sp. FW215-L1]PMX26272.1 disulfide bond formation protein B [Pseudomonas sp. FW215-E1]PNA33003.1 disulfide bond formation protein B [Pseudomonas sp. FW215-R4]
MSLTCSRSLFFMAFTAGTLALGASYYLEYAVGLVPCSLCLVQRLFLSILTVCCGVAAVHGPGRFGLSLYWSGALSAALGGTMAAWRQVLLQSDSMHHLAQCAPNPEELFSSLPWLCALARMFNDSEDCAQLSWTLFDLSIPEWSLLFFVALSILAVYQLLRLAWSALQRPLSGEASHRALLGD